ncbi:MAG: hypothetical protein ACKOCH_01635, partial [Bacteroidota bacterium]
EMSEFKFCHFSSGRGAFECRSTLQTSRQVTRPECAAAGRKMAELKLAHFGPLPDRVDRDVILGDTI